VPDDGAIDAKGCASAPAQALRCARIKEQ